MVQGTTSDAGKSTLVAALCRAFLQQNKSVVPFKPQNMALNSAVTIDGGEIGRAQAFQAYAAGLEPMVDMNPVLLKPTTDMGAQIIIQGKALHQMSATQYHGYKTIAMEAVLDSFRRLNEQYDLVVVEGAGSPAEINLRDRIGRTLEWGRASTSSAHKVQSVEEKIKNLHAVQTEPRYWRMRRIRLYTPEILQVRSDSDGQNY